MKRVLKILLAVSLAVAVGLIVRARGVGAERIFGTSMQDTLASGDIALVTRWTAGWTPARGEVVLCQFPGRPGSYVKRLVGLPGETVTFFGGALSVDGAVIEEPYVTSPTEDMTVTLGEDEYLVLGDNRADSYDSRSPDMGPIGRSDLLGRVRWVLWPLNHFGQVQ